MSCIDGFVIAVPTANKQAFIPHARQLDPIFLELGALRMVEGWGWGDDVPDDLRFPGANGPEKLSVWIGAQLATPVLPGSTHDLCVRLLNADKGRGPTSSLTW